VEASVDDGEVLRLPITVDGANVGMSGEAVAVWACASQVRAIGPEGIERSAPLSLRPGTSSVVQLRWSRGELDSMAQTRKVDAEKARLAELEADARREMEIEQGREAQRVAAFNETAIFIWNVGALTLMIGGGSIIGLAALATTPVGTIFDTPQLLPSPSTMVGINSDDFLGIMIDIVLPATLATVGLTFATLGVVWLFTSDLSSAPVWPTDICYGPCACATQPLVPDACLGVE